MKSMLQRSSLRIAPIDQRPARHHGLPVPRMTPTRIQAFQAKQALGALVVDQSALAVQQHVDLRRALTRAHRGDPIDPYPKSPLFKYSDLIETLRAVVREAHSTRHARRSVTR